jgi:hypothetical protein
MVRALHAGHKRGTHVPEVVERIHIILVSDPPL